MAKEKTTRPPRTKKSAASAAPTNGSGQISSAKVTSISTKSIDIQETIRQRAYDIFEQRGRQHGFDLDDWLRAEAEVLNRFGARSA